MSFTNCVSSKMQNFKMTTGEKNTFKLQDKKQDSTSEWQVVLQQVRNNSLQTKKVLKKATDVFLCALENKSRKRFASETVGGRAIPADAIGQFCKPYKYNATCGSVLELLFFQRFWISLSRHVPTFIMPCTITITGLVINLTCCTLVLYYSPEGKSMIPAWVMLLCSAGMFAYQTLDALDGKQASKLQNTHLEEIADHGSDSLSTSFVLLAVGSVLQLGTKPTLMIMFCVFPLLAFYTAHWQTHVTDVVVFGKIDVTEGQCFLMSIHVLSAMTGQWIWQYKLPLLNIQLNYLLALYCIAAMCLSLMQNLRMIFGSPTPLDSIANIPRRKGLSVIYPAVSLGIWFILLLATWNSALIPHPNLFCLLYGIIFTKLLIKMQISTLGKVTCKLLDSIFCAPFLLVLNQWMMILPPSNALQAAILIAFLDLLRFVTYLVWDICECQDIYIFTLKYPVGHEKNQSGSRGIYINGVNNNEIKEKLLLESEEMDSNMSNY